MSGMFAMSWLVDVMRELARLPNGERSGYMAARALECGCSPQTLYRRLQDAGYRSGRKPRSDKGRLKTSEEQLRMIALIKREGTRKNGKSITGTAQAMYLSGLAGQVVTVSEGTVNRSLRQVGLNARRMAAPSPKVALRSLHPNHVHAADPSLCVVYHLHGKQYVMDEDKFYANKLEAYTQIKWKVWRYVCADHFSNAVWVRYYLAKGENQTNLYDFLKWCWSKTEGRTVYGTPKGLMVDPGSANTAAGVRSFCRALNVELLVNEPGKPWAKGFVEKANDLVERHFESLLRFQPVADVDEMNARALQWQELYNADLGPVRSALRRPGMAKPVARMDLWLAIKAEELRPCPPAGLCDFLFQGKHVPRTLDVRCRISYQFPTTKTTHWYDLRDIPGLHPRDKVEVVPFLLSAVGEIYIRRVGFTGEEDFYPVLPISDFNPTTGFRDSSPVIGQEYKAMPKSDVEREHEAMDRLAYGVDPDGVVRDAEAIAKAKAKRVKPFAHLNEGRGLTPLDEMAKMTTRTNLPKRSTPIEIGQKNIVTISERFEADQKREQGRALGTPDAYDAPSEHVYSVIKAAQLMRERLGEAEWSGPHFMKLQELYPDGVPETKFEEAFAALKRAFMFRVVSSGGAA